ncbi:MAG: hypothetical protein LBG62_03550 [Candidatus Methanoplasma sp.]|jgi:molecular chaperone GrpE (heat shock protein)|nr:hypothetical protein [Candidatus Methanoplasma sp.]
MSEKRMSKTEKLRQFLVTGSIEIPERGFEEEPAEIRADAPSEEPVVEDVVPFEEEPAEAPAEAEPEAEPEAEAEPPAPEPPAPAPEPEWLRGALESVRAEIEARTTTKEQLREYAAAFGKRDAEAANREMAALLERLSAMREDFSKLCRDMREKIDRFSADEVLESFGAYAVDMENMLADCGVRVGPFPYDRLSVRHQRMVGIVPTGDKSMNGAIAERVSDGYEYLGRVLLKEKVNVYRFTGTSGEETDRGDE